MVDIDTEPRHRASSWIRSNEGESNLSDETELVAAVVTETGVEGQGLGGMVLS
jgi:hypothetical protein